MRIVAFEPWHLDAIERQSSQRDEPEGGAEFAGQAYTAMDNGAPIACAGFIRRQGKTFVWATLSEVGPRKFVGLHRVVRRYLDDHPETVEAFVDCSFEAGRRWMALLGFEPAGEVEGFVRYQRAH